MYPAPCLARAVRASIFSTLALVAAVCPGAWSVAADRQLTALTVEEAITRAVTTDPGLQAQYARWRAMTHTAVANAQLTDPTIRVSAGSVPIDSFDLAQEPMTQLLVGIEQRLPRGKSLALSAEEGEINISAEQQRLRHRRLDIVRQVSHDWLALRSQHLILSQLDSERRWLDEWVDLLSAHYRTASFATDQRSLISARIALVRLHERRLHIEQNFEEVRHQLAQWLPGYYFDRPAEELMLQLLSIEEVKSLLSLSDAALIDKLQGHPAFELRGLALDKASNAIALAEQAYGPAFALQASYGYRPEDPFGQSRSDFVSVGVSFDVPLFTSKRQDQRLQARQAEKVAAHNDRQMVFRSAIAELRLALERWSRLHDRQKLFTSQLLPEIELQGHSVLAAYNQDKADVEQVVQARMAEIDAHVDLIQLETQMLRAEVDARYWLSGEFGLETLIKSAAQEISR